MCLAIPGKILSVDNDDVLRMAKVSFGGVIKNICIEWLPETKKGDYVLAHAGTALSIVNKEEAQEAIKIFNQWANELEENEDG